MQGKVPYTAYLKFVDYWLIYGTILPFIVFIVETAWELGMGDKKTENQVRRISENEKSVKNYYKTLPKYLLPLITLLFVISYTLIALYILYSDFKDGGWKRGAEGGNQAENSIYRGKRG